jgi:hypothetical protein
MADETVLGKKKRGRKPLELPQDQFEKLCGIQCTKAEIAAFFSCDPDTINNWCKRTYKKVFEDVYAEKRKLGYVSLRRNQFRMAENNPTMAIFLGKNMLGQRDNPVVETVDAQTMLTKIAEYIMHEAESAKQQTSGVAALPKDKPAQN